MAIIKRRLNYNDPSGEAITLHLETSTDMVVREDGTTVEDSIQATDAAIEQVQKAVSENQTSLENKLTAAVNGVVDGAPEGANTLNKLNDLITALSTRVTAVEAKQGEYSLVAL